MEHGPFADDLPIDNGAFPQLSWFSSGSWTRAEPLLGSNQHECGQRGSFPPLVAGDFGWIYGWISLVWSGNLWRGTVI